MTFQTSRIASRAIADMTPDSIDSVLLAVADALTARGNELLEANAADCAAMDSEDPRYDRLLLTPERIADIASGIHAVAALPSPLGLTLDSIKRPNGLLIRKVSVPFGVIGAIFEARPNVIFDIFSLCFKAGSACVLKGGHEAARSDAKAIEIIRDALEAAGAPVDAAVLVQGGHEAADSLLKARGEIDLLIPRGSRRLIDYVRDNALVPVIETGAGVCHTYFHTSGDIATGRDIIFNAKTRRPGVCNALDCLIVDRSRLGDLPALCYHLSDKDVEIYADDEAFAALDGAYPLLHHATEADYGREWLDYKLTVHTVECIDEALDFISRYSSQHSECIIAESIEASERFLASVDAACVYANVSTAFTDGGQFGFGAEIGISTQKLHARGPMALREITTYKYLITGAGQTRS
ncbi:MAG: glutamate-5-semialdehyde dehydrogenase [Muribaculaceae bacterium]|nr:glutamate-5-semialdehyde dehydrogenase [Muribaculaceae bacterium]